MKIQKEFAPITIKIETKEDLQLIEEMLLTAYRKEPRWQWQDKTELQDKITDFARELGIWK